MARSLFEFLVYAKDSRNTWGCPNNSASCSFSLVSRCPTCNTQVMNRYGRRSNDDCRRHDAPKDAGHPSGRFSAGAHADTSLILFGFPANLGRFLRFFAAFPPRVRARTTPTNVELPSSPFYCISFRERRRLRLK